MRLAAITLIDVPEAVRRRAAEPLIRAYRAQGSWAAVADAIALERAVQFPSGTTYRVPADAVERVLARP